MKKGSLIFLSASVPHRPDWIAGSRPAEIEEAVVCVARAVFARGGRLLFGGHPSISPLVSAVAGEYYAADPARTVRPVITFQSEWFRGRLPDETWEMHRMGFSSIEWTPKQDTQQASLDVMREWMLARTPPEVASRNHMVVPSGMVAIGGMEGILEEAALFLRSGTQRPDAGQLPVYALQSGGGAAAHLLQIENWERWRTLDQSKAGTDARTLRDAHLAKNLRGLEQSWRAAYAAVDLPEFEFPPHASMAQWLMDTLD